MPNKAELTMTPIVVASTPTCDAKFNRFHAAVLMGWMFLILVLDGYVASRSSFSV